MDAFVYESVEDLAFVYWQYSANEKAYANKLITKPMYELAKGVLQKNIESLSQACYSATREGVNDGFIKRKESVG